MKLIEEWKSAWKLWSVQLMSVGLLVLSFADMINQTFMYMAPALASKIPHAESIALVIFGMSLVSRILKQEKKDEEQEKPG